MCGILKVWSIALVARETRLVVGSSDRQLRVWCVEHADVEQEVGGAPIKAIAGQKRALSSDNDVTEKHGRNVSNQ